MKQRTCTWGHTVLEWADVEEGIFLGESMITAKWRHWLWLWLLLGSFFGGPAQAKTKDEQRTAVLYYLSQKDMKLTRDALDHIGQHTQQILVDLVNLRSAKPLIRMRACAALGFYPSEQSFQVLNALLYDRELTGSKVGNRLRQQAIRSLGRAFPERAVEVIQEHRKEEDAAIRMAVAQAFGDTGAERALPLLLEWLPNEPVLSVRLEVDRAIRKIKGF